MRSIDYSSLIVHPVLTMPRPLADGLLIGVSAAVVVVFIWSALRLRTDKGVSLIVCVAGLACCGMEGFAEYMAMNYHPEINNRVAYTAWGMPVPVHIALSCALYFGGPGAYMLTLIQRGMTDAGWWRFFAINLVFVLLADMAALHFGVWAYFGPQPFVLLGVPMVWMLCNVAAIFAFAVIAHACMNQLRGAQRLLTITIAPVGLSMTWAGVSLPISNALYSDAGPLLTCGVSLLIVGLSIRYFRSVKGIDLVRA